MAAGAKDVRRDFRLSSELDEQLRARASAEDRSVSWCIVRAVEAWLGDPSSPEGADRARAAEGSPVASRAAQPPATPRASVPAFARVQKLGEGPPRTINRRGQ